MAPSSDRTSYQEFGSTSMAPILRRAGSIARGGKHREYRIECNHKGPRFAVSTTALQLWLNGKRNRGSCQDDFCNNFSYLRHLTAFDSNRGRLDSKHRLPTACARHFKSTQPPEWTKDTIRRRQLNAFVRAKVPRAARTSFEDHRACARPATRCDAAGRRQVI